MAAKGLFVLGDVRDSLLNWRAKMSSFDASCSIDVQLLVGAGVEVTKAHLAVADLEHYYNDL